MPVGRGDELSRFDHMRVKDCAGELLLKEDEK